MSKQRIKPIGVRSMFGHNTRQPLVLLRLGDEVVQMPPAQAREIGHWLLEAAEGADGDAALVRVCAKLELDDRMLALLLTELRDGRGKTGGDTSATESGED
jgi:hypothetical protein